jgi:hypothetical protein
MSRHPADALIIVTHRVAAVLRRRPGFVPWNAPTLFAHTFRGSTWRSVVGLESARDTFARYKAIRTREREFVTE